MKTGNTLRTAKNSLLCFFMTLAGGFLVACGSSSDGGGVARPGTPSIDVSTGPPSSFSAYLLDTAVKGVSVSGPTGDGMTGDGGVFAASDRGVFEFSIGGTTLGSVRMSSNPMNSEVTPSDFMGLEVASEQVITIARIMQALDADGMLANGISISESARANTLDLFSEIVAQRGQDLRPHSEPVTVLNFDGTSPLTISSSESARNHLVATRSCLFSGGYVGAYRANGDIDDESIERGTIYYAVEPFADRVRRFGFTVDVSALHSFVEDTVTSNPDNVSDVGVSGRAIGFDEGGDGRGVTDVLNFVTPRLVDGTWNRVDGTVTVSGIHDLVAVAGEPGATRRIVGVETTDNMGATVAGMYVLDYFANDDGVFSGQYYSVNEEGAVSALSLTLTIAANGGAWHGFDATAGATAMLTLTGTRGEEDTTIIMGIVRDADIVGANENYGTFFDGSGPSADSLLSGTWCDIGGAVGSTVAPTPPTLSNTDTVISITWAAVPGATVYNLYLSTVSVGSTSVGATVSVAISGTTYMHDRPSADTEYFYQLEACNSAGCSERSDEVRTPPPLPPVVAGQCVVGQRLMAGESCTWREMTFEVNSGGSSATFGDDSADLDFDDSRIDEYLFNFFNGGRFAVERIDGTVWEITQLR